MLMAGCTPAYNWRQVSHEGAPASMLMPCKPERAQRRVPLMGADAPWVELSMLSCEVQGQRFAWATVRIPEGADELRIEQTWRKAAWASLGIGSDELNSTPTGWRQLAGSHRPMVRSQWEGPGRNHRGESLQVHFLWLQSDGWMHQAALYGSGVQAETIQTFFDSFSVRQP